MVNRYSKIDTFEELNSFEIWYAEYEDKIVCGEDNARCIWVAGVEACKTLIFENMADDLKEHFSRRIDRLNF